MGLTEDMIALAQAAKLAARQMTRLSTDEKNACLRAMADALETNSTAIKKANNKDMEIAHEMELSPAMLDRLLLDDQRITNMAQGLREVAQLEDPVGRVLDERGRPSGLKLQKVSCPIGVVVIIYESRPNVTADAAGLCFKSGNTTILRGGKEALNSNQMLAKLMVEAGRGTSTDFPKNSIQVVPTTDRRAISELLSLTELVDLCIPRGGEGLIRAVADCSRVPVIKHYKGICSVYLDGQADLEKAINITVNSKALRPGVCNAMEALLVDKSCAKAILPAVANALQKKGVELRCCENAKSIIGETAKAATKADWDTEYLDLICSVRVVDGIDRALKHINIHGSGHTDCIITEDESVARRF